MGDLPAGKSLQTQIDELGDRMDAGFKEITDLLRGFEDRVRNVEQRAAGCQPFVQARIDAAWRKIDEHSADIKALGKTIEALNETISALKHTNKILTWVGGIMGSTVVVWVLGQWLGLIQ